MTITGLRDDHRIVTIVHLLTPAIRQSDAARHAYVQWRDGWRALGISFVEIDLLRGGDWTAMVPKTRTSPAAPACPYRVCVSRGSSPDYTEHHPIRWTDPLPTIGVPLRPGDADATLDLQALMAKEYRNGGCDLSVDYAADADPPLTGPEAAWADGLLRAAGRRPA